MGVLSSITKTMESIVSDNHTDIPISEQMVNVPYLSIAHNTDPMLRGQQYGILNVSAPQSLDYFEESSMYFVATYQRASYYFYNCSILSTVIRKIVEEALRNGIEFVPRFQSKCPRCGTEYENTTKRCRVCGFKGIMHTPDLTQKELLINWRGRNLLEEVNKNGWTMQDLAASFTILSLVYNQPLILCKSLYAVNESGEAIDEIPQEFVPIAPTKARMLYDNTGEPGKGTGFTLFDRSSIYDMNDCSSPESCGYHDGMRLYPARWCISEADGGWDTEATYYANEEIFHKVYSIPSMTYGTPFSTLIEYDIRAWISLEMRVEKYYNTGHPQGIFAVSGITPEQLATIQQSIREQMVDDPYSMPMMGIPPGGGDTVKTAKWFQLADNPTGDMMKVKSELQQRIAGAYGVSGLFLGDVNALKGNSNETQQLAIMDRNLAGIRTHINAFLGWIVSKYRGITDWTLRVTEPADEQTRKQAEDLNKELINAQLAQNIGFPIISLIDNKIEIGVTPINIPVASSGLGGNNNLNDMEARLFGTDVGSSSDVGRNMMREISTRQNPYSEKSDVVLSSEQVGRIVAELVKSGVKII